MIDAVVRINDHPTVRRLGVFAADNPLLFTDTGWRMIWAPQLLWRQDESVHPNWLPGTMSDAALAVLAVNKPHDPRDARDARDSPGPHAGVVIVHEETLAYLLKRQARASTARVSDDAFISLSGRLVAISVRWSKGAAWTVSGIGTVMPAASMERDRRRAHDAALSVVRVSASIEAFALSPFS